MEDLSKPLVINAELFLQCHGSCAGCFLTEEERAEDNTHLDNIKAPILSLLKNSNEYSHVILGFGRGNLLNMSQNGMKNLLDFMVECEKLVPPQKITYEVSSSLIGKIDKQIEKAEFLLSRNRRIYFNVVINSEITSTNFWANWNKFQKANSEVRLKWGMKDKYSDILVLNINPKILPNLEFIEENVIEHYAPLNISLFPFSNIEITNEDLAALNDWSFKMWNKFKHKDLNIKNYLESLNSMNLGSEISDILNYHNTNKKSYFFVDKNGEIIEGSLSIMGEVDYVRLLNKFSTNPEAKNAILLMQKTRPCNICNYQKECLLSGAYLNMVNNAAKIKAAKHCLSGYQSIFEASQDSHKDS